MGNVIIVGIIIICVIVGARETVKHFRGQSACCGGGTQGLTREKVKQAVESAGYHVVDSITPDK